ncbi:DUF421 domain-containing protein [Robertmurraya andreesenii]|uniref:Uncharacterized membrane protein YcaP (DUF421 family) n=1 Tax=Anoxybacillus andreesenii TaxID=1325932 RepID=A0ABT9V573_9BACL|nr:DUF421 domain-containing protein [Robertmurraya andreesenii]MDQ0156088.1 uncharacterized membrane protein YcaP (DUF421 family) [Robertmurraya andreesenii]
MSDIFFILGRTIIFYALIIIIFRAMGKREIGELSILDLVVYIMIAEMAVLAIEKPKQNLLYTIVPMLFLMSIQITFAFISLKSKKFRDIVEGKPTVIINNGKIDEEEMRKQRYNFDDLLLQLREKNIKNIADVEFAILETSGKLSVFEKEKNRSGITIPLIIDGQIQERNLERIEKNLLWFRRELKKLGYKDVKNISFCSYQDGEFFIDVKGNE